MQHVRTRGSYIWALKHLSGDMRLNAPGCQDLQTPASSAQAVHQRLRGTITGSTAGETAPSNASSVQASVSHQGSHRYVVAYLSCTHLRQSPLLL